MTDFDGKVFRNNRAKIYALFTLADLWQADMGTEAADAVTQLTIGGFLTFKRSEVWVELREELDAEGVHPTEVGGQSF